MGFRCTPVHSQQMHSWALPASLAMGCFVHTNQKLTSYSYLFFLICSQEGQGIDGSEHSSLKTENMHYSYRKEHLATRDYIETYSDLERSKQ